MSVRPSGDDANDDATGDGYGDDNRAGTVTGTTMPPVTGRASLPALVTHPVGTPCPG